MKRTAREERILAIVTALTRDTNRLQYPNGSGHLVLGSAPQIRVEKTNAPTRQGLARSDQTQHVEGVEMANAHPIFVARIPRNPVHGSARP